MTRHFLLVLTCALWLAGVAGAQTYTLVTADSTVAFRLPGADGQMGTADDVERFGLGNPISFDPNWPGSWTWSGFPSIGDPPDPGLPAPGNRVSFGAAGTLEIDLGATVPLTAARMVSSAYRQGLGRLAVEMAVTGGTWDSLTGAFSLTATGSVPAFGLSQGGVSATGRLFIVDAPFAAVGDTYVDNVLAPRAAALGAAGFVYLEMGGAGLGQPFSGRVFAIRGSTMEANLAIDLASSVPGPLSPGAAATVTIEVMNTGPAAATGVRVVDLLPPGATWSSDGCGAGPPTNGVWSWNVGSLASGGRATCDLTLAIDAGANSALVNGAMAVAQSFDPDATDNLGGVTLEVLDDSMRDGLCQDPNGGGGFQSDLDCDACPSGVQVMAENFKIDRDGTVLRSLRFHGAYSTNVPFADDFTVELLMNRATTPGLPAAPADFLSPVTGTISRRATGATVLGFFDQYEYVMDLNPPMQLDRGVYWLAIVNDSIGVGNNDWFWETAEEDAEGRSVGYLAQTTLDIRAALFATWNLTDDNRLSLKLDSLGAPDPAEIPVLGIAGRSLLAALLAALGLFAIARIR